MTTATMNAQAQSGAKGLDAGKNAEASKYDQYVGMVKASGYNLDTSVGNVNVIGIQGWLNGNVVDNVKNKYNDTIVCVYQRKDGNGNVTKHCAEFIASVDPGTYAKVNAKGSANLLYGQHTYQKGTHKGYAAYNPVGPSKVWRDKNNDGKRAATDKDDTGYFGINIHAAGSYKSNVGNWSEGCQVIASKDGTKGANNTEFKRFRDIISKQDKDQKFVYTLLQGKTAWNAYQKDGGNNVAENSGDVLTSNAPENSGSVLPSNAPENSGAAAQGGRQMNAEGHPIYYPKGAKETQEIINWNKGRNYTEDYIRAFQKVIDTKDDGGIGTNTVNAIRDYQVKHGLSQDGKWGKECADHAKLERKYNSGSAGNTTNASAGNATDASAGNTTNDSSIPTQAEVRSNKSIFGDVDKVTLTSVSPAYPVYYNGQKTTIKVHPKVATRVQNIFAQVRASYTDAEIQELGLNKYSGCYNKRKVRGGSAWSIHAWGIAIDIDAARNPMNPTGHDPLASDKAKKFWDIVEANGGHSQGRNKGNDWMHFQFAKYK